MFPGLYDVECKKWKYASHAVFHLGNACLAVAFVAPSNFSFHCVVVRLVGQIGW